MDRDRWRRIDELFDAACARPDAERETFVRAECRDDPGLAEEVLRLLAHDDPDRDPFGTAVHEALTGLDQEDLPGGGRVGIYRLERELGRGGMGTVFLAERADGEFEQQVALKVIRRGLDSDQILERFRRERQILARLQHPNIARLLDGGIADDGRPYFAMEYVVGKPIDTYCDERRLTVDERLDLFQDVCRAIRYAHASLVVHRDLKPDNILVTDDGQVRLLDFGIARLLAEDDQDVALTHVGHRVMTPAYASPEQVRGEPATTATDVYSLGVILYELLAGVRPLEFGRSNLKEIERLVSETDPERPSTRFVRASGVSAADIAHARGTETPRLRRRLIGDLDVICLKTLQREPQRRYGSVEALLEDIRRHRTGLPIRARPDTLGYRLRKGLARNRAAIVTASAVVLLTATLVGYYTNRLAAERDVARQEAAKAAQVADFLKQVFEVSYPSQSRGETVTARELLDAGALRIEEGLGDQPDVQATMLRVVGEVYRSLGLAETAEPYVERAYEQHRAIHGEEHEETATSRLAFAHCLQDVGDGQRAEPLFRKSLATRERLYGRDNPLVCESLEALAFVLESNGHYDEAEAIYRDALERAQRIDPPGNEYVTSAKVKLGRLLRQLDRYDEAEPLLRQGLVLQRAHHGARSLEAASTARNLAALLRDTGGYEEADALYREVLDIRRGVLGPLHPEVANTLNSYAMMLQDQGDLDGAIVAFEEQRGIMERLFEAPHPKLAAMYHNIGMAMKDAGKLDQAIELFTMSMVNQDSILDADHPHRAYPRIGLATTLMTRNRHMDAIPILEEALEVRRSAYPAGHRLLIEALTDLGRALTGVGRFADAEALLLEARATLPDDADEESGSVVRTRDRLAELYAAWSKNDDQAP